MQIPGDIQEYLIQHSKELGERILSSFPPLHGADDEISPLLGQMLRRPHPAQTLAMMGISKRWQIARDAHVVVAECGAGKSIIALGAMLVHSAGQPFSAVVMSPPHLVDSVACRVVH